MIETLMRQNKPGGHMCASCAWTKPAKPHLFEFCEKGAKATTRDLTTDRCGADFFAAHSVTDLRGLSDRMLKKTGRLTHPMRLDPDTDSHVAVTSDGAFASIGAGLRALPRRATMFPFQFFARLYGHNNLPDS